jgi:hypothetical protein
MVGWTASVVMVVAAAVVETCMELSMLTLECSCQDELAAVISIRKGVCSKSRLTTMLLLLILTQATAAAALMLRAESGVLASYSSKTVASHAAGRGTF